MDAHITVSGNLGTEVEHRSGDGYSRASFRLASTPRLRRGQEWVDGHTTWVTVECSNRVADNARDSLAKGDPVVVFGKLRTHIWVTEGVRNERLVVEASSLGHDLSRGTSQFTRTPVARDTTADQPTNTGESAGVEEDEEQASMAS